MPSEHNGLSDHSGIINRHNQTHAHTRLHECHDIIQALRGDCTFLTLEYYCYWSFI